MILNAGLSGLVNYGCDIGGFAGPAPDKEVNTKNGIL
jgi:alpha-glucosidase (family GH31 glycosyl hydrolase)